MVQLRALNLRVRAEHQQQPTKPSTPLPHKPIAPGPAAAQLGTATKAPPSSLFAKLGGRAAMETAVDRFYNKVVADPTISGYFANTDMKLQRSKQYAFLAYALGGATEWKGKDMRTAHKDMAPKLNDVHFSAVTRHLYDTLTELGVDPRVIQDAMAVVASTRTQVLNLSDEQGHNGH